MFRDRVDIATEALDGIRWPFQRLAWAVEDRVVWPLQDLAGSWDRRGRAAMAAGLVLAAGTAATAGALWAGDGTTAKSPAVSTAAAITAQQAAPQPQPKPEGPVLQGAAPVFGVAGGAEAKGTSKSAQASTSAAGAEAAATGGTSVAPKSPDAAITGVARRFAEAFVLYEIGLEGEDVRKAFGGVATPALARALANRPPRQPEQVDVPRARVLNVVLGPRRGKSFRSASVSLLRVGSVSELRVDLRRTKSGWLVSDVRG